MSDFVHARYRNAFIEALAGALGKRAAEVELLVKPAEPAHGDFTFPTFALAKAERKAPPAIAAAVAPKVQVPGLEVTAVGPYINARLLSQPYVGQVVDAARKGGSAYGASQDGAGKTVVIDYSSPNIAKPIGFHHIRTTLLGHAIANLYRSQGYRVEGVNYLGDWGKQFGLVAVGFKEFGDPARQQDMAHLVDVYVKANAKAEEDPEFDAKAKAFFREMEDGNEDALRLWREFRATSLEGFKQVYARLGITFEHYDGESLYHGKMDAVIAEIARTVGTLESQGALIVNMPYADDEPPVLLKKKDGSTLYATRDLAAAFDRFARFHFDIALYVVAVDQALHFKQVFRVLEKMGVPWVNRCTHVAFGRVHGMSTRKGQVVLLNDVVDEAKNRALEKVSVNVAEGRIHTDDVEKLAEQIGLGAVIFGDLKNRRASDYTFDWEEVLTFEGHTGPYLQYAYARTVNLLKKGGGAPGSYQPGLLTLPEELDLARAVGRFPEMIGEALKNNEPSYVARHLLEVAAAFSRWYTLGNQDRDKRVLVEEPDLRGARLALADAVRATLVTGLTLLGMAAPESM